MKAKEEREALKNLLDKAPDNMNENVGVPGKNMDELQPENLLKEDFEKLKQTCEKEAKIMIKNAISFMIPMDMIRDNKYLKDKFKVDVISLAGMLYQLKTNELVQKALMEQINLGMAHPRMFEVFSAMSKTIGELNKQLLQTVEAIKETYKTFKEDVKEKRSEALGPSHNSQGMLTAGDGSVVTRGTKELINNVKKMKQKEGNEESSIEDAKIIPDIPSEYLNT